MGTKIFHIIEARDPETRHVEDRRVYTTEEQYLIRGMKQVEKFNKVYDVKVTKYICEESVEVLDLKVDELQPKEVDVVKLDESDIKRLVKRVLSEQEEGEEYSPPEGPHENYYDVGLALRRIVVNKDTGEWVDTDYLEEESIMTAWDLKDAEKMYQRKLFELKFFDTKGKVNNKI